MSIRKAKRRMDRLTRFHDRFPDAAGSWAFERAFTKWAVKKQHGGMKAAREAWGRIDELTEAGE